MFNDKTFGIFLLLVGSGFLIGSYDLNVGTYSALGPGFFPIIVSIFILINGILLLIRNNDR